MAVQCKGLVEAGRDTMNKHMCFVALDAAGEDGCGIAEAIYSKSSEMERQTSISEYSPKGLQVQGWVR